jgi:hypothetical protein
MFDDEEIDWSTLLLIGGLIWLGSSVASAAKKIKREVEKFSNFGLTSDDDKKASDTIADKKATTAAKLDAIKTLRVKVDGAKAAGYSQQVKALELALDALEKELHGQDELEIKRQEWLKRQQAQQRAGS